MNRVSDEMIARLADHSLPELRGMDLAPMAKDMAIELRERRAADKNLQRDRNAAFKLTADLATLPEHDNGWIERSRAMDLVYHWRMTIDGNYK